MAGVIVALSVCLLLMGRLVNRFRSAVTDVRNGHPDGHRLLSVIKHSGISFVQIPKLVGLALFSWLYTFFIISTIGKASTTFHHACLLNPYF